MKFILAVTTLAFLMACNANDTRNKKKKTVSTDAIISKLSDTAIKPPPDTAMDKQAESTIGGLALGMTAEKVRATLGEAGDKSKAIEWGADGLSHQDWMYKDKGLTLNMSSEKAGVGQTVFSITVDSPCTLKTATNIGIGSSYQEVMAAYAKSIDKEATDAANITVGSVYGGMIFSFKKDKVERIFIGAAAE